MGPKKIYRRNRNGISLFEDKHMQKNKAFIKRQAEEPRLLGGTGNSRDKGRATSLFWSAKRLFSDPLTHFLIIGFIIFSTITALSPDENEAVIIVDDAAILTYIQYRSKAFDEESAWAAYRNLSADEKTTLVNDYAREEALYREAKKLGFENGDYIIRQRLIQKLDFIAEAGSIPPSPDVAEMLEFYTNNSDEFSEPERASFTHIFFSKDGSSYNNALVRARAALSVIERAETMQDGSEYGDRFLYQSRYTNRTHDQIVDMLGPKAAELIFSPEASINQWVGPVTSHHGVHLIFISSRRAQMTEPFEAVQDIVEDRMRREEIAKRKADYIRQIVTNYQIKTKLSPLHDAGFTE
ncbi:MAG: peptidyl-prolyl cis-trans isomerase [Alphaproteobacteria bacterium]|nr:peptidyl-prolyl cis-trans isomerase [Alphaproteobacteria bacterium]